MSPGEANHRPTVPSVPLPATLENELIERLDAGDPTDVEAEFCQRCPEHVVGIRQVVRVYRRHAEDGESRQEIGDYTVLSELGRGAMGVVYAARQRSLDRTVALKVLPRAFALDESRLERFRREVGMLARLRHDHIVCVFDAGEVDGVPYLAMELVAGASLAEAVQALATKRVGELSIADLDMALRLPPAVGVTPTPSTVFDIGRRPRTYIDRILTLGTELCDALAYAHAQGVIHRDIKPQNVLVDRQGRAKLLDFGLARGPDGASLSGTLAGTPVYMSPEQILAGRVALDHRTDIYSLGAMLYELLTLRPPFAADSLHKLFRRIQWDDPPSMAKLNPTLSHDLVAVIEKAMAKNPDRRYPDAPAFGADLRRLLRYEAVVARGRTTLTRLHRRLVRHRWAVAIGSGLLVTAGAILTAVSQVRAADRAALEAERAETQRQWLARLGRVDALHAAGEVRLAARELEGMTLEVPVALHAEVASARARVEVAIDAIVAREAAVCEAASATAAQLEASAAALADVGGTIHRAEAIEELRVRALARAGALRETELFRSPDAAVRKLLVLAWAKDLHAGKPVSEAREAAFRTLLADEQDESVLRPALAAIARLGFARYAEVLHARVERGEREFLVHIALAAALAGETDWLARCRPSLDLSEPRRPEAPGARSHLDGAPDLTDWDTGLPWGRWSSVFGSTGLLGAFAWDLDFPNRGSRATEGEARSVVASRFLLGDRALWGDLAARIEDPEAFRALLAIAEARDDPRLMPAVHRGLLARRGIGDLDHLLWASRLVATRGLEPPREVLDRAAAASDHDSSTGTLGLVVAELFDRPTVRTWALERLRDPLTPTKSRAAIYAGFHGRVPGERGSWDGIATRPDHATWMGRERRRVAVIAQVDEVLRSGPTAAWFAALDQPETRQPNLSRPGSDRRFSPLMFGVSVAVDVADALRLTAPFEEQFEWLRSLVANTMEPLSQEAVARGVLRLVPVRDQGSGANLDVVPLVRVWQVWRTRAQVVDQGGPLDERQRRLLGFLNDPEPVVQRAAALALADLGRARDVEAVLRQSLELYGPEPEVLRALAYAAAERGDHDAAAAHLRQVVDTWDVAITDAFVADARLDRARTRIATQTDRGRGR